jgi:hypothetical protein
LILNRTRAMIVLPGRAATLSCPDGAKKPVLCTGFFYSPASGQIRLLLSDLSNLLYSNREYMSTLFPAGLSPAAAVLLL